MGAAGGATRSRRSPAWWTCWTASRTPSAARPRCSGWIPRSPRAPASRRRRSNWMPAPCCRANRRRRPVVVNDRAYTIRVRFPERTRALARGHPATRCWSVARARRDARLAGHVDGDCRPDRDPPREPAAQRGGDGALRRREPGRRHGEGAEGRRRAATCRPRFAWSTAARTRSSRSRSTTAVRAGAGDRAGVHRAAVRVRQFRRADRDPLLGAALHLRRVPGAAGHGHDVQHLVVHGADHGDRHRGQERHSAARRRPEVPRGGHSAPKKP